MAELALGRLQLAAAGPLSISLSFLYFFSIPIFPIPFLFLFLLPILVKGINIWCTHLFMVFREVN